MSSPKPYYDAEHTVRFYLQNGGTLEAYGSTLTMPDEYRFGDLDGVRRYVKRVCEMLELGDPPSVVAKRGTAHAHYDPLRRLIAVPEHKGSNHSWAMREIVVLHELAHHLDTSFGEDSHGPTWAGVFVFLVTRCIGYEAGFLLSAEFSERGVQFTPYRV